MNDPDFKVYCKGVVIYFLNALSFENVLLDKTCYAIKTFQESGVSSEPER